MKVPEKLEVMAKAVAAHHGMRLDELIPDHKNRSMSYVRREVAVALRQSGASHSEIGVVLKRDPSTISYLLRPRKHRVSDRVEVEVASMYESVGQEFAAARLAFGERKSRAKNRRSPAP